MILKIELKYFYVEYNQLTFILNFIKKEILLKTFRFLRSIPGIDNKSLTISISLFLTAIVNGDS